MSNEFASIEDINKELLDLRLEVIAQGTLISVLLNFIEVTHGVEARQAITDGLKQAEFHSFEKELNEDELKRFELLRAKYRQFM